MSLDHFEPYQIRVAKIRGKNEERRLRRQALNCKTQEEHAAFRETRNMEAYQQDNHRLSTKDALAVGQTMSDTEKHARYRSGIDHGIGNREAEGREEGNGKDPGWKEKASEDEGVTETVQKFTDLREKINRSKNQRNSTRRGSDGSAVARSDSHGRSPACQDEEPHGGNSAAVRSLDADGRSSAWTFREPNLSEQRERSTHLGQTQVKQREREGKKDAAYLSNGNLQVTIDVEIEKGVRMVGDTALILRTEETTQRKVSICRNNKDPIENKSSAQDREVAMETKDLMFKKTRNMPSMPGIWRSNNNLKETGHYHNLTTKRSEREWDKGKNWNPYYECCMSERPFEEKNSRTSNLQHSSEIFYGSSACGRDSSLPSPVYEWARDQTQKRNQCKVYGSNSRLKGKNTGASKLQGGTEIFYGSSTSNGDSFSPSQVQDNDPPEHEPNASDGDDFA